MSPEPWRARTKRGVAPSILCALMMACGAEPDPPAVQAQPAPPVEAPTPISTPAPVPETPPRAAAPIEAPDPLSPTREDTVVHTVRPGEDAIMIAARYDEAPRWLRRWNRLEVDEQLRKGRRLSVRARRRPPPLEALEYVAREGDSVRSVARRHGIGARRLARLLRKKKDAPLEPGTRLELWVDPTLQSWLASLPPEALQADGLGGAFGVGAPDDGYLANAVAIPQDPGWELRFPHQSYGDSYAVEAVVRALRDFRARSEYAGPLRVWSMSRRYGGELTEHNSHRTGRDLDIKLPLRADLPGTLAVKAEWVDYQATWELIDALARTEAVQEIYLDHEVQARVEAAAAKLGVDEARRRELLSAPRPKLSKAGLVRHYEGHADHLHVRFRCAPWGVYCTDR